MTGDSSVLSVAFRQIAFGSEEYRRECRLRDEILRRPLGISLTADDLAAEAEQLHFGLFEPPDRLVACVVAVPLSATEAKIRQMAVSPSHQGRGFGRRLLTELETDLRRRGFRRFVLNARTSAAGFYERLGYAAVGNEFVDHTIPHVLMTKTL